jgi:hypothetical protein
MMCDRCVWEDSVIDIKRMVGSDRFDWAHEELRDILDRVLSSNHITEKDYRTVQTIINVG